MKERDHDRSTRRDTIRVLGAAGMGALFGCGARRGSAPPNNGAGGRPASGDPPDPAAPACVVRPEQEEGPYFVDERLNRSDLRADPGTGVVSAGTPLRLQLRVWRIDGAGCRPLPGATVDVWHADAAGVYSDALDINGQFDTRGRKFLRGYQTTDAGRGASFLTVYPGWYAGRAVHLHLKVRVKTAGGPVAFTTQLYFPDEVTDEVHAQAPYSAKPGRRLRNLDDEVFGDTGAQLILPVTREGAGYGALWYVGLRLG